MDNNTQIVNYDEYPEDAGNLLAEYGISKNDITEQRRAELVFYLEQLLIGFPADTPGRFSANGVTVTFTGHNAAGNLHWHYR